MAKKKELPASVALFDDEVPAIKKQEPSKQTSKAAKREIKTKTSKPSKETKSSPKEDNKPKKEIKPAKKNVNKDTAGNTSGGRNSTGDKGNSTKKKDKEDGGRQSKRPSDTSKKSASTSKSSTKSTASSKRVSKTNDKPVKSSEDSSVKRPAKRVEEDSDRSTEASVRSGGEKQTSPSTTDTDFAKAKKHKYVFKRGTEIWPPKQITGKPRPVKDGELLAIVIDGKYLEVSPWSVKDGIYRQGMDSNFLVTYLHYETVATKYDASNEELSKIVKKKEGK